MSDAPCEEVAVALQTSPAAGLRSSRAFWSIAYTLFVLLTGTNIPTPLYRGYAEHFGFSPLVLTLIFSVYVGSLIPTLLVVGPLSDAIGRRQVLLPAVLVAALGSLAFALAQGTSWLFCARILQGLAIGAAAGPLTAALSELEPQGRRHKAALVSTLASLDGLAAGPLISGLIAQYGADGFVLPYALELILLIPAAVAVTSIPGSASLTKWKPRRPSVPADIREAFIVSGTANFLAFSVIGLFLALVPTYAINLSHSTNLALAGGSATLMLSFSMVAQIKGYGKNSRDLQLAGMILLPVGLLLLTLAGHYASIPLLLIASLIAGGGHGLTFLGGLTEINHRAPQNRHADVVSTFYVIVYLGVGFPVIGIGLLATHFGLSTAMQTFTAVIVPICFVEATLLWRRGRG